MDIAEVIAEMHALIDGRVATWKDVQAKVREAIDLLDADVFIPDDLLAGFTQERREHLLTGYLFSIDAIAREQLGQPRTIHFEDGGENSALPTQFR